MEKFMSEKLWNLKSEVGPDPDEQVEKIDDETDDLAKEYDEEVTDEVLRRRLDCRKAEAASWKRGGNLVDECGVLCDLDKLNIAELKYKFTLPEYEPTNRKGLPLDRLKAVLRRKMAERDGGATEEELASRVERMSAKEYVRYLLRDAKHVDDTTAGIEFGAEQLHTALDKMNRDVAVIKMGNAVRYLVSGIDTDGRHEYRFLSARDFHQLYANALVPGMAVENAQFGKYRSSGYLLSKLWDTWGKRRELEGIGFFPGSSRHAPNVPKGYLNLWSGLAIEPKKGDWSLFKAHLRNKVCAGDKANFDFLMDWLAHAVQKPQEKPGSAIVLKSSQKGSGKSMLLKFLRAIFGRYLYSAAKIDQLIGRFNGHLEETLIFGVEEGFWAGNRAANSGLKDLITGEHIAIERKGLDSRSVPNFTRFIFLSNESWVVPAGTNERRYFVLEFEHERAKDQAYFDPIFEQMEKRGGIEAMLYDLMQREIKANLRNPPTTAGLLRQRAQTLDGVDRFLFELATEGEIVSQISDRVEQLKLRGTEKLVDKTIVYAAACHFTDKYEGRALQTVLGMKLASVGVAPRDAGRGEARKVFVFPPIDDFRAAVSKVLGLPITVDPIDKCRGDGLSNCSGVLNIQLHKAKRGKLRSARLN